MEFWQTGIIHVINFDVLLLGTARGGMGNQIQDGK